MSRLKRAEAPAAVLLCQRLRVTAVFFGWLLYIHPFDDGNGRTSRIAASLALRTFTIVPVSLYCNDDSRKRYLDSLFSFHTHLDDFPDALAAFVLDCAQATVRAAYDEALPV